LAISYQVLKNRVVTNVEGEVTLDDVRAYLVAVRSDPAYRPGIPTLIDCRKVTTLLTPEDLRTIVADIRRLTTSPVAGRCAMLAPSAAGFGLLRMFEAYSDGAPVEVRAFHDDAEALAWLDGAT
jgi:hypothetical protein